MILLLPQLLPLLHVEGGYLHKVPNSVVLLQDVTLHLPHQVVPGWVVVRRVLKLLAADGTAPHALHLGPFQIKPSSFSKHPSWIFGVRV